MKLEGGIRACDTCGATDVPLENVDRFDECARCRVRGRCYDRGAHDEDTRDALRRSAEAMFRAMNERGLRAVEILAAAQAAGEGPVAEFLTLLERSDGEGELRGAEYELLADAELAEDGQLARRRVAERYAMVSLAAAQDSPEAR